MKESMALLHEALPSLPGELEEELPGGARGIAVPLIGSIKANNDKARAILRCSSEGKAPAHRSLRPAWSTAFDATVAIGRRASYWLR